VGHFGELLTRARKKGLTADLARKGSRSGGRRFITSIEEREIEESGCFERRRGGKSLRGASEEKKDRHLPYSFERKRNASRRKGENNL